jgi:hypothetical protein
MVEATVSDLATRPDDDVYREITTVSVTSRQQEKARRSRAFSLPKMIV